MGPGVRWQTDARHLVHVSRLERAKLKKVRNRLFFFFHKTISADFLSFEAVLVIKVLGLSALRLPLQSLNPQNISCFTLILLSFVIICACFLLLTMLD